jgi:hypothetical protein
MHEQANGSLDRPGHMSRSLDSSLPSDIHLLLRADAEQCWLNREVIPVLRDLESREEIPAEEVGAALAYLEAMWSEASVRAQETDAAHSCLAYEGGHEALSGAAGRYHAAVCALRGMVGERVAPFVEPEEQRFGGAEHQLRVTDRRAEAVLPDTGGYTPRAA